MVFNARFMMKKLALFVVSMLVCLPFVYGANPQVSIGGVSYSVDTLSRLRVGPGTFYTSLKFSSPEKTLRVFFLEMDMGNPYLKFESVVARDSVTKTSEGVSAMAKRTGKKGETYFAGVNADFFSLETETYARPLHGSVVKGQIGTKPASTPHLGFAGNVPLIAGASFSGSLTATAGSRTVSYINQDRGKDQLVFYNRLNGKYTHTNSDGTEVLLQLMPSESWGFAKDVKLKVVQVQTGKGNMFMPEDHAVLSGNGNAATFLSQFQVNDEVTLRFNIAFPGSGTPAVNAMVGGDQRGTILRSGVPYETWNELHPRTGAGFSKDKSTLYFCVVDGRTTLSAGVTTKQLAEIMLSAGAYEAMNLDGGGSSAMYIDALGIVNSPSDGSERAVGNAVYAVNVAPEDAVVATIQCSTREIELPLGDIFTPVFYGYNQYGTLIDKHVQGVSLSCDPDVGTITENGSFQASGSREGLIYAEYKGCRISIPVKLLPAVYANVYASELDVISGAGLKLAFTLNTKANAVRIDVKENAQTLRSIEAGSLLKGRHVLPVDLGDLPAGTYQWSVTTTSDPISEPVKFSNDQQQEMQFYSPRGVAVDNNFDSPFFGRIYASETSGGTVTNRSTSDGIYILNAAFEDITGQFQDGYKGGVSWTTASSPMRLCVAPDGKVYLTDWSDSHSGVWIMDPADPAGSFTEVFAGNLRNSSGLASKSGVNVHGSISHCWVTGTGEDTKLFTFDEDYTDAVATNTGNLLQYNIGTLKSSWNKAPSAIVYNDALNGNLQQNFNSCIAPDGRGGWWISQYRQTDSQSVPCLIHVNPAGSVDFNSGVTPTLIGNSETGGMAVNQDGSILAMGCKNEVKVFRVTFNASAPSLSLLYSIQPAMGNICGISFDLAGNLYAISNVSERLAAWALPKPENTFTTPAPAGREIRYLLSGIADVKNGNDSFRVYPNPVSDWLNIETGGADIDSYALYTIAGQKVLSGTLDNSLENNSSGISFKEMKQGVYLLALKTTSGYVVKRIIKQ